MKSVIFSALKKTALVAMVMVGLLLTSSSPVAAQAIDCSETCPSGTYKSTISGSGFCECVPEAKQGQSGQSGQLEVTSDTLDSFDPLRTENSEFAEQLSTPGGIISRLLEFAFPLAGMILFVMIVIGGFQMIMGSGDQKAIEAGQQRVTMALVGFLVLFASYWIAQILQELLNISILG